MRKELLLACIALFLMSMTAITGVYAVEMDSRRVTLEKIQADITGDGEKDEIFLQGIPYNNNEIVYKDLFFRAKLSNGKIYEDKLSYGIDPKINLVDLNHDGIKDVFLKVPTGQSGGIGNYYLFTAKDFILLNVPIPELELQGQFKNGYKAKIDIPASKQSYVFDLMTRKDQYDSLGMYQNGKLNEPVELTILPYGNLTPLTTNGSKYGLRGIQKISGTSKTDTIAFVESTWYFTKDGVWKLVRTKVKEVSN